MSSSYGENLKLTIFGQSHGPAIGMTLEGIPAGLPVDTEALQAFLSRRAPGNDPYSTTRKEPDVPEFLSGIVDGFTCGAPITAIIHNTNTRSGDYNSLKNRPRPGHADYTAHIKYGGAQDAAGGGHFSGRLTAPMCIAGGLCKQWLEAMGIAIGAHVRTIGNVEDRPFTDTCPELDAVGRIFPTLSPEAAEQMQQAILEAKANADSIGGSIECAATGVPAGLGEPMFGGVENRLSGILYGIPAVKGLTFGSPQILGSQNNDPFCMEGGTVATVTNHCGGILGGITNGMPVIFTAAFKPTPSIGIPQQTVDLTTGEEVTITVKGRHDPCIVPRAVPVVEAAAAIAMYDLILGK